MNVIRGRLYILAFAGLTVAIVYNALYLQEAKKAQAKRENAAEIALGEQGRAATPGTASEIMRAIQRELASKGFDPGPADGLAGEKTRSAIRTYQKKNGLPVTGEPSMELLKRIVLGGSLSEFGAPAPETTAATPAPQPASEPKPVVKPAKESPGEEPLAPQSDPVVESIQGVLADLGYAPGPVDGLMGEATRNAILIFKRDRGLPLNGDITPRLIEEIERVTGRNIPERG